MKQSYKFYAISLTLIGATSAWAASTAVELPFNGTTTVVTTVQCEALTNDIRVGASKDVVASSMCSTSNVGIATASTKGLGSYYRVHSGGSTVTEFTGAGAGAGGRWTGETDARTMTTAKAAEGVNIADNSASN